MEPYFRSLATPLSDYTFSQLYTWRNSLRIVWAVLERHLCVFANGSGDLTLLLPPIGDTNSDAALARCVEIMDDYNAAHGCLEKSRVEYVSEELLTRFDRQRYTPAPQGNDYLYDVQRMIDLSGGDLASKRQAKNRFMRNHRFRTEVYDRAKHFDPCRHLLNAWKERQDQSHANDETASFVKRTKESLATQLTLDGAHELGLKGLIVYVENEHGGAEEVRGFTFGEPLGADQSSIVIEKTDLECKGLAQFIFSEFCRTTWADRPLVNAGDDWGLETLAWTKNSYRPVKLLKKYVLTPPARVAIAFPASPESEVVNTEPLTIRPARKEDLDAISTLEQGCFAKYNLSRRQLQYLQQRDTAVFLVAEKDGRLVGEGIALLRHHKQTISGRAYSLAVDPAFRGQGIGERLMKELVEQLKIRGARRIYLEVEASNTPAVRLYQRLGFNGVGALPDYYGQGKDGLHMMYEVALPASHIAA
jgi:ribosomal-protein-alanine acetyltransferase